MKEQQIIEKLIGMLNHKRLHHSIRVGECAAELATFYNGNPKKAYLAGLLHDCAKGFKGEDLIIKSKKYGVDLDEVSIQEKGLIHGPLGAKIAKESFGIDDPEILSAIEYHTFGKREMTLLEKIIYIADLIEIGRSFSGVDELRALVWRDLDMGILKALEDSIISIISKGRLVHPNTLEARNYMIMSKKDV